MSKVIYLAGGCFWGVERLLAQLPGVISTEVGYANGPGEPVGDHAPPVTYDAVCAGSGHAETVRLAYDQAVAPSRFYLEQFLRAIDPLAVGRQGGDVGIQYRSGVYWTDPADQVVVELELATLERRIGARPAVESGPLRGFTPAEEWHQRYLDKHPGGHCHIAPAALAAARQARPPEPAGWAPADPERVAALSPLARAVTQDGATERPFTGAYDSLFEPGVYVDVTSGTPLFASSAKFDAGCGWPAFARPIDRAAIREVEDLSYDRRRTEVRSRGSGAHLGHVFADGPAELGGLRYCVNSAALEFVPASEMVARGYGAYLPLVEGTGR
ncbi:MAG: peptide-methionine (R)-S-oxide reductase MsrB [Bifidobacteriaceae bacterium]|jgi:peptide methionine sulfoxide reductase msrA/msrB|nr:peptide-methionine (R)-S-oxide reductase MsrB [Bifidobacteriaceae bacterium]